MCSFFPFLTHLSTHLSNQFHKHWLRSYGVPDMVLDTGLLCWMVRLSFTCLKRPGEAQKPEELQSSRIKALPRTQSRTGLPGLSYQLCYFLNVAFGQVTSPLISSSGEGNNHRGTHKGSMIQWTESPQNCAWHLASAIVVTVAVTEQVQIPLSGFSSLNKARYAKVTCILSHSFWQQRALAAYCESSTALLFVLFPLFCKLSVRWVWLTLLFV